MKKLFTILFCSLAVVGVANATGKQLYLVGDSPIGTGTWSYSNNQKAMTLGSDGITNTAEVTLTEEKTYFAIADGVGSSWDDFNNNHRYHCATQALGDWGGNFDFSAKGDASNYLPAGKYVISINSETMQAYITPNLNATRSYYVIGSNADVFGGSWNLSNVGTMTGSSNIYTWTKTGVSFAAGETFEWKVLAKEGTGDLGWDNQYGPMGYKNDLANKEETILPEDGIYTLTFKMDLNKSVIPEVTATKTANAIHHYTLYVNDQTGWGNDFKVYAWNGTSYLLGTWAETLSFTPETEKIGDVTYKKYPFMPDSKSYSFIFSKNGHETDRKQIDNFLTPDEYNYYITVTTSAATINHKTASILQKKEYTTYVTEDILDFTDNDLKAYIATGATSTKVNLQSVEAVPSATPLVLKGTADTKYEVKVIASADAIDGNLLVAGDGSTTIGGESNYDYILSNGLFYRAESGTVAVGKAYLHLLAAPTGAPSALRLDFEENNATDIEAIEAVEEGVKFFQNGKLYIKKNGVVYDMLGTVVR